MNFKFFILLILTSSSFFAQEKEEEEIVVEMYVDDHYLEDQVYFGILYNFIINTDNSIENNDVPFSIQTGIIKDIPLNKKRNKALGLGIGYSYEVLRPNIVASENEENSISFSIDDTYTRYDYTLHSIEIPLEYRWRTSTPTNNSFWRVYTGISYKHTFDTSAEFDDIEGIVTSYKDIKELNQNNFSIYTSVGFGTWNLHVKYQIKPVFKESTSTTLGEGINFNQLNVGVMFYIL